MPGWKGKKPSEAVSEGPEFPWPLDYLWGWFGEFSMGLKSDGMGPVMASWGDVEEYNGAMHLDMEPWEKTTLVRLAYLRASVQSEQQQADMKKK